jgi:hypothetical protein
MLCVHTDSLRLSVHPHVPMWEMLNECSWNLVLKGCAKMYSHFNFKNRQQSQTFYMKNYKYLNFHENFKSMWFEAFTVTIQNDVFLGNRLCEYGACIQYSGDCLGLHYQVMIWWVSGLNIFIPTEYYALCCQSKYQWGKGGWSVITVNVACH